MTTIDVNLSPQSSEELLCPVRYALDIVGGKWKLPIICMLVSGKPTRYSTLKRKLAGITNMMLAQSLKEMEASGIVHRMQYNEVPPRVEYTLTDKGKSIIPVLMQLADWGAKNMEENHEPCGVYCDQCQTLQ